MIPSGDGDFALYALVGLGLLVVLSLTAAVRLFGRWRTQKDLGEILRVLEDLRAGEIGSEPAVDSRSPLRLLAQSTNRLSESLRVRQSSARAAAVRTSALLAAARGSSMVITDADGDVRSLSMGAEELFGWAEGELAGQPAAVLFQDESYKNFLPKLARRSIRVGGVSSRSTMQRKDRSLFAAVVSVRLLEDEAGNATGFSMLVREVSEEARLEAELRATQERYRRLVEDLDDGVVIVQDGRVVYANPAFAGLCAADPRGLPGSEFKSWIVTRDLLLVEERLGELQGAEVESLEFSTCLIDSHGTVAAGVRVKGGAVEYQGRRAALLQLRDETTDRRLEVELRKNERQLDAVIEAGTDGILVFSHGEDSGTVQMTNRAFTRIFGLRSDEMLGVTQRELLALLRRHGAGAEAVAEFIEAAGNGPRREAIAVAGAPPRRLAVSLAPLRDRAGTLIGRVVACRDVTEQRRSEDELQDYAEKLQLSKAELERAYDELDQRRLDLEQRGGELSQLNHELRELDRMKTNLLGNVTHELSTPLVSIRGYTEMILKGRLGPITEEQRDGLTLALTNIDRLISMIDNLLSFSRRREELGRPNLQNIVLRPLVDEAAALLREEADRRGIGFRVDVDPALTIHADRDKILQVLINLFSNAVKFNREQGSVRVTARPGRGEELLVRVQDTGIGIPGDQRERIFERDYRIPSSEGTGPPGRGLGLSIVRDILRLHGCRIAVESEPGKGSTFSLTLPRAIAEEQPRPVEAVAAPEPENDSDPGGDDAPPRPRFRIIRPNDG